MTTYPLPTMCKETATDRFLSAIRTGEWEEARTIMNNYDMCRWKIYGAMVSRRIDIPDDIRDMIQSYTDSAKESQ